MNPRVCHSCRRTNPPLAAYCYFDGTPLATEARGPRALGAEQFPTPFVFPSGRTCRSFEELARACRQNWAEARCLLKDGGYRPFLMPLGRADLVQAVDRAASHPDLDLGLDDFLAQLPGCESAPPRLEVERAEFDLGAVAVGQDRQITLSLLNRGERLLSGLATSTNCPWLGVSTPQLNKKRFLLPAGYQLQLLLHVRGKQLRAAARPQVGEVVIKSNGGARSVHVRILVPVTPFPDGALMGAQTPRQLAEKARAAPHEAARFLENGSVARWYQCNGWIYPITGPAATGLAVVQQYFEALGFTTPTQVELRTTTVALQAAAGGTTQGCVVLSTSEKRPIYAHAQVDQPWLSVGPTERKGNQAIIPLRVETAPACSGQTLRAELSVQANGGRCFKVPVSLQVGPSSAGPTAHRGHTGFDLPPIPGPYRCLLCRPRRGREQARRSSRWRKRAWTPPGRVPGGWRAFACCSRSSC
jgi:hypothetical protein